jgi:hypothetical protein
MQMKKIIIMGTVLILSLAACVKQSDISVMTTNTVNIDESNLTEMFPRENEASSADMGSEEVVIGSGEVVGKGSGLSEENHEDGGHQWLSAAVMEQDAFMEAVTLETYDFPAVGLHDVKMNVKVDGSGLIAYSFGDYRFGNEYMRDTYVAIATGDRVLWFDFGEENSYDDQLYGADVDGDGADEVVMHRLIAMSGGAGSYTSLVFKVVQDKMQLLFQDHYSGSPPELNFFDTGYFGTYLGNCQMEIRNRYTDMHTILDLTGRYEEPFFDETQMGQLIEVACDSFFTFVPEDVDGDGKAEIICEQYVSLRDHADGIGTAKTVLTYDIEKEQFKVTGAEFIPYI